MKTSLFFAIVILAAIVGTAYPQQFSCSKGCYCCKQSVCIFEIIPGPLTPLNCFPDEDCLEHCPPPFQVNQPQVPGQPQYAVPLPWLWGIWIYIQRINTRP